MLVVGGGGPANIAFSSVSNPCCGGGSSAVWYLKNIPTSLSALGSSLRITIGQGGTSAGSAIDTSIGLNGSSTSSITARSAYRVDGAFIEDSDVVSPLTNYCVGSGSNGGGGYTMNTSGFNIHLGGGGSSDLCNRVCTTTGWLYADNGGDGTYGNNGSGLDDYRGYGRFSETYRGTIPVSSIFEGDGRSSAGLGSRSAALPGGAGGYALPSQDYSDGNWYTAYGSGQSAYSTGNARCSYGIVCIYYHNDLL